MDIHIDVTQNDFTITNLPFEGVSPLKEKIAVNSRYITKNGMPWYPVSGEFQFSRYTYQDWEKEILKMKAAGITLLSSYIMWIHHEEIKNQFNFTGDRNLREFLRLCSKHKMPVILRVGPWIHGEVRNGGFPDWLLSECKSVVRTPDPLYLGYVDRYFKELGQQCEGMFFKDGGCIIGVQIDNECWTTAENEKQKKKYMMAVKEIAIQHGFVVPFYTATAWGRGAVVDMEMLPSMGGYADAPWSRSCEELPPSPNFLMTRALNDDAIGSDLKKDTNHQVFTCDIKRYPYLTCEIGGGLQCTKHRRPVAFPLDTLALAVCKLGSGANMLGFYVYHGGTNPDGELSTLQESKEKGYPNDLPIKSYDFQAPLGECGRPQESYYLLKPLLMMLKEWGDFIAPSCVLLPKENAIEPEDTENLRLSVRYNKKTKGGILFINNHLRKRILKEHKDVEVTIGDLKLPSLTINNDDIKLIPFNFPLGSCTLKYSNATPLTRIGKRYFFYTDEKPYYQFQSEEKVDIITLNNWEASRAAQISNSLYIADSVIYEKDQSTIFESENHQLTVKEYHETGACEEYTLTCKPCEGQAVFKAQEDGYSVDITYKGKCEDYIMQIEFEGDQVIVYENDKIIADWFFTGLPFRISLKKYQYPHQLFIKCRAKKETENIYYDILPKQGEVLKNVKIIPVYSLSK